MQQVDVVPIGHGYCYERCVDLTFYATYETGTHRVVGIYCQWIADQESSEVAHQVLYGEPTICQLKD